MSCLPAATRARYIARLARLQPQLEAIDDAIDAGTLYVQSASLDTGEGKQSMRYKSFDEMQIAQTRLERRIERYYTLLNGTGIVNMNLRRKSC